ncbi:hypothetical protein [Sorangium sp. So ce233]|uniref:hypothetical protein n=1 Tax=Sorangium sp. So ce233 TaxID=3133290 RepID=UPI003F605D91
MEELLRQIASLQRQLAEILLLGKVIVGLTVLAFGLIVAALVRVLARLGALHDRQARLEAWQEKHGAPLERLALEQDASSDPARAAAVRHPQRGGSPDAPL